MDRHVTREILRNIPTGFVVFLYRMLIPGRRGGRFFGFPINLVGMTEVR
jgi:hypothetical protein